MKTTAVVVIDQEIMSGTPCFAGTRVPAQALLDYLEAGDSLDEFLADFPTVTRRQAVAFIAPELLRCLSKLRPGKVIVLGPPSLSRD